MTMYNEDFMNLIIEKAQLETVDVPVCALIAKDNKIISIQTNKKEETFDPTAHAEMLAIKEASGILKNWRLDDCDMYVTLEPCPMCAGAIISSRIKNLYFGSYDCKYGGFSTGLNLKSYANSNLNIEGGKMEEDCNEILKEYFKKVRNEKASGRTC